MNPVLLERCPWCGSEPEEPCVTQGRYARKRPDPHVARLDEYYRSVDFWALMEPRELTITWADA